MLLRCAPLYWRKRSIGLGRLGATVGLCVPGPASGDLDAGAALRWRFRPILGIGLLLEKTEKHWNDKKRARQKEYKQKPQKPPRMKKVHVCSFIKTIATTIHSDG